MSAAGGNAAVSDDTEKAAAKTSSDLLYILCH